MLKLTGTLLLVFLVHAGYSQIITPEIEVTDVSPSTTIKVNGTDKLNVHDTGVTVIGNETVNGSSEVLGNHKVNGDLSVGNSFYQFSRWTGISFGAVRKYRFATDFSAGFTIEVTLAGNVGPSASTMFSKKTAIAYYQYANVDYKNAGSDVFNRGVESGYVEIYVAPVGSNNQFDVVVWNRYGNDVVNTTVRIDITTRASPSLTYIGAY